MNYRKGRLNQKGLCSLSIGRWLKRIKAKRTCREDIEFLDEEDKSENRKCVER